MIFSRLLALLLAVATHAWAAPPYHTYSIAPESRSTAPARLRAAAETVVPARVRLPGPPAAVLEKVREANDRPGPKRIQLGIGREL